MSDPDFCQLFADEIGRFAVDDGTVEHLIGRLRQRGDYPLALAEFRAGATERVVRGILRRGLIEITGESPQET